MYIQITTRCNMACEHCGMNCTANGEDMSRETFKKALEFCDEIISIGGGEPTIHPLFWDFLGMSLATKDDIWMATNGSIKDTALTLAKLTEKEIIICELSLDPYHDKISREVEEAFFKIQKIRDTSGSLIKEGRCEEGEEGCICEEFVIVPNGNIKQCGCLDAPIIGSVYNDDFMFFDSGCYKELENIEDDYT